MTTTIQVSMTTRQVLKRLKEERGAASYDDVIRELVSEHTSTSHSFFGAAPKLRWTKKDRLKLHEL